jgi:hypothetical protein
MSCILLAVAAVTAAPILVLLLALALPPNVPSKLQVRAWRALVAPRTSGWERFDLHRPAIGSKRRRRQRTTSSIAVSCMGVASRALLNPRSAGPAQPRRTVPAAPARRSAQGQGSQNPYGPQGGQGGALSARGRVRRSGRAGVCGYSVKYRQMMRCCGVGIRPHLPLAVRAAAIRAPAPST